MSTEEDANHRHLTAHELGSILESGVPVDVRVEGDPEALIVIDPRTGGISLRIRTDTLQAPDLTGYRRIRSSVVRYGGRRFVDISVDAGEATTDAYPILCQLVDRIQLNGEGLDVAATDVLGNFRRLLEGLGRLSVPEEVGLSGELWFLEHLALRTSPTYAVNSWAGADMEEHDFVLDEFDVEVKATTSERRAHRIHGLGQLTPSPGRPLWLVSIQLTEGGPRGTTLGELVDRVRGLEPGARERELLDHKLTQRGWDDSQSPLYTKRLGMRSKPESHLVGPAFPALTEGRLMSAGIPVDRIDRIEYQIDLTGLSEGAVPPDLDGFGGRED